MNETMIMMTVPDWFLWLVVALIVLRGIGVWLDLVKRYMAWRIRRLRENR